MTNFTIPPLVEKYLQNKGTDYYMWNAYTQIVDERGKANLSPSKNYKAFYDRCKKEYTDDEFNRLKLPTPATINGELGHWNPDFRSTKNFTLAVRERMYVILIGFVMGFTPEEVDKLLSTAGLQTLSGRSLLEVLYIYSLTNHIPYDQCVLQLFPTFMKEENPSPFGEIKDLSALSAYVHGHEHTAFAQKNNAQITKLTVQLTKEALTLDSEEQLKAYIQRGRENFLAYRETPRKELCKKILERFEEEELEDTALLQRPLNRLWREFKEFYCDYTTMTVYYFDSLGSADEDEDESFGRGDSVGEGRLLEYVQGKRQINRKVFILLMLFLEVDDLEMLDAYCMACGFGPISCDHPSLFDQILSQSITERVWGSANNYGNKKQLDFLDGYMLELSTLKVYSEAVRFDRRIENRYAKEMTLAQMNLYHQMTMELSCTLGDIRDSSHRGIDLSATAREQLNAIKDAFSFAQLSPKKELENDGYFIENPLYLSSIYDL